MLLRFIVFAIVTLLLFTSVTNDRTAFEHLSSFQNTADIKTLSALAYYALHSIGCMILALVFTLMYLIGNLDAKKVIDKETKE